jgi:hypothetical protein
MVGTFGRCQLEMGPMWLIWLWTASNKHKRIAGIELSRCFYHGLLWEHGDDRDQIDA